MGSRVVEVIRSACVFQSETGINNVSRNILACTGQAAGGGRNLKACDIIAHHRSSSSSLLSSCSSLPFRAARDVVISLRKRRRRLLNHPDSSTSWYELFLHTHLCLFSFPPRRTLINTNSIPRPCLSHEQPPNRSGSVPPPSSDPTSGLEDPVTDSTRPALDLELRRTLDCTPPPPVPQLVPVLPS